MRISKRGWRWHVVATLNGIQAWFWRVTGRGRHLRRVEDLCCHLADRWRDRGRIDPRDFPRYHADREDVEDVIEED